MSDLSRWNIVDEFTAKEAACLILGFDAHDPNAPTWAIEPMIKRLRESYSRTAVFLVLKLCEDADDPESIKVEGQHLEIMGRRLMNYYLSTPKDSDELNMNEVVPRLSSWFDDDTFRRPELSRWLSEFHLASKYQFDLSAKESDPEQVPASARVLPKGQRQENRIIELLRANGYDPMQLPNRPRTGRGNGVKAEIKVQALKDAQLFTLSTFSAAWDRLRLAKRLAGGNLDVV